MLDHEYRKKRDEQENKRDWLVTTLFASIALLAWSGVAAVWKYIGHDGYIIASVIVPLSLIALMLSFGALHDSRKVAKSVGEILYSLFYFWV